MTAWPRPGTLLAAALALAACETGRAAYEAPLRDAGVIEEEKPTAAERGDGAPPPGRINDETYVSPDTFRYRGDTYRIADLSPGERPPLTSDEAGLWMAMDRFEQRLETSGTLARDDDLLSYIRDVACRVAHDHCGAIRVHVVENPTFNASMAPNGLMLVHTGLLLRTRNEAELAAVLGHEIGHYLRRHSYQRMVDIVEKTNFLIFFQVALSAGGVPSPVGQASQFALLGSIAAFSRDNEREADGYGSLLLHRTGYDPRAAADIWARITRENEARDEDGQGTVFFTSHPQTTERQEVLSELGAMLAEKTEQMDLGRERYQAMVAPRRTRWLRQETHMRQFKRSHALFDMMLEDGVNPAEIHYFKGELYRLRGGEDDPAKALEQYETALTSDGLPPTEIYRSMGLLYRARGDDRKAADAFRTYLTHAPDSEDRLFIETLIETLAPS